jgi:hypothetical protein
MIQQITAAKRPILIAPTLARSRIFHEADETEVYVELHVAMIQGETGIIGNEIDFDALPARTLTVSLRIPAVVFSPIRVNSNVCR